jgi:signal transduction histidine kinase
MSRDDAANWLDRLAHDLRGPLAPLQTASYLLRRDDLDPGRRDELLSMLERQTQRLARMLDELDDWTRAGRQRLLGQHERGELALLLDYALVGSSLGGTPVDDDGAVIEVDGDQQRLTQLLRTLVDLAVSRGGVPQFSLRSSGDHGWVQARMPGPAPDAATLATFFDTPQPEPYDEGLGLRLMLAREIARAHGGELSADVDDGTLVLRIDLPLAPPA